MELSPSTRRFAEKLMETMKVPGAMRSLGLAKLANLAEPYAKENGHHFIRNEDFFKAVKEMAPEQHQAQIIEAFQKAGVDTDKEFPEWKNDY